MLFFQKKPQTKNWKRNEQNTEILCRGNAVPGRCTSDFVMWLQIGSLWQMGCNMALNGRNTSWSRSFKNGGGKGASPVQAVR